MITDFSFWLLKQYYKKGSGNKNKKAEKRKHNKTFKIPAK